MSVISLDLPSNILHSQEQILKFDKIATFIGGNGSGKSTILKSIFDAKLQGVNYKDHKIVCFSSGQNESYSINFSEYLNSERSKKKALNLDCFFYDKLWSMLLIFLATASKKDGQVRRFLEQNNYITQNDFDEDISTKLSFDVKVDTSYTKIVQQSLKDEINGETDVITNKAYHRTLNNFINVLVDPNYDFTKSLEVKSIKLTQEILSQVSFEEDEVALFDSKVMFFTQAADNNYFIVKNSFELTFEKDGQILYLSDLSDGEYQLLFLYSLIDLFDSQNTLFLLDEADSHLHYKNIEKLWNVYNNTKGSIITTTHLLDSIAKAGSERIKIIENGKIESSNNSYKLLQRLDSLSDMAMLQYKVASMYKNIVLMDNSNDWEIFKLLVQRKLSDKKSYKEIEDSLSDFICLSVSSSFHTKGMDINEFGDNKISWVRSFEKALNDSFIKNIKTKTKNAFLICDGDEFPKNLINDNNYPSEIDNLNFVKEENIRRKKEKDNSINNNSLSKRLLSWKRREIKHYLLSFSALSTSAKIINDKLPEMCHLTKNKECDYLDKDKKIYNEQLGRIESKIVKDILKPYIDREGYGFCVEKTQKYVNKIPKEEISEDIVKMYNYLVGENGKCSNKVK
ncbi:AAA family ATPase [Aliarcobacter butzleri]|uniref:AAA family ATPase n=1 Tax=Aliarcobacter butzleri TaxID=28197 RepID=UPI001EDB976B|nr:AAA family ATPase [Aliarcobacter butzleri]MCG3650985.1 AAA family ATPase [Aliarcobacter butzleri]